jgi:Domain of unknown function (DUF4123)
LPLRRVAPASFLAVEPAMGVMDRFDALKAGQPRLLLCALVDGLVFEQMHGRRLESDQGCVALFDGTDDEALAYAGPWLVNAGHQRDLCDELLVLEATAPLVSLLQLLRRKLDVRLPDGSTGLLRFYDPRVLHSLATTLTDQQREEFFGEINEWHFMRNGRVLRIGRADA